MSTKVAVVPGKAVSPGALLSQDDVDRITAYVRTNLTRIVVSHLQSRVLSLHATVKASRQGLQNKLRSWLGGKKDTSSAPLIGLGSSGRKLPRYTSNTIEAQIVKLADYVSPPPPPPPLS